MERKSAESRKEVTEILAAIGYEVKSVREEVEGMVIKVTQNRSDRGEDSRKMIN